MAASKILKKESVQMPYKDPSNWPVITWLLALALSMLGGLVKFLNTIKSSPFNWSSLFRLVTQLVTSAFAGLLTLSACNYAKIDPQMSAILIAISGHMGIEAITELEKIVKRFFNRFFSSGN